jgi:serine/threonine-protein kinase
MPRDLLPLVTDALAGRYTVERELGRGGAARVYLAHAPDGRPVALKVLHPELQATVTADRFLREISLVGRIAHPHIAQVLDSGESGWLIWYVMPYVPGPTLRQCLDRATRLRVDDTLRLAGDLLDALAHAHAHGIVHRDVKPENVVVASGGAVLVDFGIEMSVGERLTRSGVTVGTSAYMSPEQITGERTIDGRTDLYSLACVLFECLAGRPPFTHQREQMLLQLHLTAPPPDVRRFRPETPAGVAAALDRALAKRPEERWPGAAAMHAALLEGTPPAPMPTHHP